MIIALMQPEIIHQMNRIFQKFCRVGYHLLLGSAKAVQEFHKGNYIGKIGLVHATGNVETEGDDEANKIAYRNADLFYNKMDHRYGYQGVFS